MKLRNVVSGLSARYVIMTWIVYILIMINVKFVWNIRNFVKVELMRESRVLAWTRCADHNKVGIVGKKIYQCGVYIHTNFSTRGKWTACLNWSASIKEGCNHAMISFVVKAKSVLVKFGPSQTDLASDHTFYRSS